MVFAQKVKMMSRRKRGQKLDFAFTAIPKHITRSECWLSLRPAARLIWFALIERYNGENNGNIILSCREAGKYAGCSKNTAAKMLNDLVKVGLIKCNRDSSFHCGKRMSRTWILTHISRNGKRATNDWKNLKPSNVGNTV